MTIKNVCIVGPGAIGGMMAVMLERAGYAVSALARPARTEAMAARGLTLHDGGQVFHGHPRVATRAADLGPQDLIVVTLKGTGLREVAGEIESLRRADTPIVFVMNGVPWWFFDGFGGALAATRLRTLDPDGLLARIFPSASLIWGVINCGVVERPDGTISHEHSNQLQLGRPDAGMAGLDEIAQVFSAAGYNTETTPRIRDAIWIKLQANGIRRIVCSKKNVETGPAAASEATVERAAGIETGHGKRIASISSDRTIKVWDAEKGQELLSLTGQARPNGSVSSPRLVSPSDISSMGPSIRIVCSAS